MSEASPEVPVEDPERTPADVAMQLLKVSGSLDFAIAVYETKEGAEDIEPQFTVEWAGNMEMYKIIGILQRAVTFLIMSNSKEEEEEDE